jgi:phosphatidylinositol dimannoside acyltransferase
VSRRYRGSGWPDVPVDRNPGAAERLPPDERPETAKERRAYRRWNLTWELARRLPEPVVFAVADLLARVGARLGRRGLDQYRRNLARVVPAGEVDAVVRAGVRSYARYWVEAFRAADMDPIDLDRRTTTKGFSHLDAALDEGRGAVILLAHHGTWDIAAQWAETHGYHLAVIAEVVRPRRLFRKFVQLRETVGLEVVPLARGQRKLDRLEEVLAANHMVGLLAERDLTRRGPVVQLFGEPARIPRGPVALARKTGAPVFPATVLQLPGRRWHVEMLPALDLDGLDEDAAAQRVAEGLEAIIRLDPAQWHALQPLWLADLPERKR